MEIDNVPLSFGYELIQLRGECLMQSVLEANTPTNDTTSPDSWLWLVDLERACCLLAGCCLNGVLIGSPATFEEAETSYWLNNILFSRGLEEPVCSDMGRSLSIL